MVRVGVVWDRTVALTGERTGALLAVALGTLVLPSAITGALEPIRVSGGPGLRASIGLLLVLGTLVMLWGQLAVTALALGQADASGPALRLGARRLPAMVGIALVLVIAFVLATLPLSWLAVVSSGARMDMEGMRTALAGGRRGTILLLSIGYAVLALWIMARLSVLMPVVVAERLGLRAIPRAFAMTRGVGLKMAGVILLYTVVLSIVTYAVQTVFGTVLLLLAGGEEPVTVASVLTALAASCVAAAFSVLACVYLAQLYRTLRAAREGAAAA